MITRSRTREASARYLNSLSKDELFNRFEVTRVADLTGYDILGIPVYSCARPCGKMISVSGGKSLTAEMARAGAVAEAIEFQVFENPFGEFCVGPLRGNPGLPTAKGSEWTPETPVAVEEVVHHASGNKVMMPSDLIWMAQRKKDPRYFMRSSNGQAVGGTFDDAFLQGLLEVVERDQITLRRLAWQRLGVIPPRVALPSGLEELSRQAGLCVYLFQCSFDVHLPVYWAVIAGEDGAFAGYGCSTMNSKAAERAILEAIQSRAVMLSGARDDILRRDFQSNRDRPLKQVQSEVDHLPTSPFPPDEMPELSVRDELTLVLHKLSAWRHNIYYKHINLGDLHAVKAIILGMECPKFANEPAWRPIRFITLARAYMDTIQSPGPENSGKVQQLREMLSEMSST